MPFVSECPSCGQKLNIPDEFAGKKVKCSKCASVFVADASAEAPSPVPPSRAVRSEPIEREAPSREPESEFEEGPSRRRVRRRDRGGGTAAPGRGGMIMTFGIVSVAAPIVGIIVQVIAGVVFPPLGICGAVFVIVGLVLGIIAWVMGSGDLKRIRAGSIDQSAEGGTKTGYITGIIGTILNGMYFVCGCIAVILAIAIGGAFAAALGIAAARQAQMTTKSFPGKHSFRLPAPGLTQYLPWPNRID